MIFFQSSALGGSIGERLPRTLSIKFSGETERSCYLPYSDVVLLIFGVFVSASFSVFAIELPPNSY